MSITRCIAGCLRFLTLTQCRERPVAVLRDDALQPHQTSVAEQVRANLALLEVAQEAHAAPAAVRGWPCASIAAVCGGPRHHQDVEGVELDPSIVSARVQGVEIEPAINTEQHGLAIEDEGGVAVTQRGMRGSPPGVQFNPHLTHRGDVVFEHACKMGLEGIVSKRLGSRYRSGRTSDGLKFKNPAAPAVG